MPPQARPRRRTHPPRPHPPRCLPRSRCCRPRLQDRPAAPQPARRPPLFPLRPGVAVKNILYPLSPILYHRPTPSRLPNQQPTAPSLLPSLSPSVSRHLVLHNPDLPPPWSSFPSSFSKHACCPYIVLRCLPLRYYYHCISSPTLAVPAAPTYYFRVHNPTSVVGSIPPLVSPTLVFLSSASSL
jgi:hypothetical protein